MIGKKWWLVPALAVAFAGCKPSEEIRTYTVEKEPEKAARPEAAPAGESKVRLLGAIIPLRRPPTTPMSSCSPIQSPLPPTLSHA